MINWKLRFQNKTTLTAIVLCVVALVYKILEMIGIAPAIPESEIVGVCEMVIGLLVLLGVVNDPTTAGIADSELAMSYSEPKKD